MAPPHLRQALSTALRATPPRLIYDLPGGGLAFLDALFGGLPDLAYDLIPLPLGAQLVVAHQRARRFLDAALHDSCRTLHDFHA